MNRIKKAVILALLACILVGCGGTNKTSIPDGMDEETYKYGVAALEMMDKYNAGDMTESEVKKRLDALYKTLNSLELDDEYSSENLYVRISISSFQSKFLITSDGNTYEAADGLRKVLGK